MSNNLERAKALAKAIRQHETGNKQIKGASGELSSRYQFMPSTWKSYAKEILGNANAPLTLENENKVATLKIKKWLDNGWSNEQVAAAWNGGEGSIKNDKWKSLVGVNSAGVKYDTPSYVKNVMKNFETFSKEMKPTTSFSQNIDIKRQRGLTDTDILNDLFAKNPSKRKEINDIRSKTNDRDALNQLSMKISGVMPSVPSVPTAEQKQQIEKEQKQQTIKDTIKKTQDVLGGAVSTMRRPEMYKEQFEEASKKIQGFPEQGEESRNEYYKRLEQQGFDPKLVEEKRKAAIKYGTQEQNKGIIKSVVSAPLDALQFFLTPTLDVAKNIAGIFGKQVPGTEEIRAGIDKTTSVFSPTNPDQELGFSTGRIAMITLAPEITQTKTTTSKAGQFMRQKKAAFNKSYKPTTYTHSTQQTPKQEPKKAYTYTPSKEAKKTADALTVNLTKGSTKINVKDFNKSTTSVVSTMDNGTKKSIATSKDPVYIINNYVETKNKAMTTAAYDVTKQLDGKVKIDGEVITNNVEKNLLKNTQYRDLLEDAKKGNEQALKTLNEIIKELEFIRTNKFDPSNILDKVINGNKSFGRYYDNPELQFSSLHKAVDKAITDVYRKELYSIIDPLTDGKFSQMRKLHSDFITFGKQLNKKYQINERARIDAQEKNPFKGFKVGITDPILHPFKTVSQIGNVIENTKKRTPFERDIQEAFKKYKDLPVEDISNVQITNLPKQQYPTMLNTGTGRTEVNQPIITPAPTTYEKPAAKIGTIDTSIQPNIQPEKPKYKSMLEALNDQEFNRKQTEAINKTNRSNVTKRSNNLYHTTPISNLDSISKKGLTTGNKAKFEGVSSSDNISFSANEVGAKYYAGDNEIIIRTKTGFKPKDLESDLLAGGEGAYITKTNIPPEMLEIKDGRKWIPIKEYTNKKSIKPVETPKEFEDIYNQAKKTK